MNVGRGRDVIHGKTIQLVRDLGLAEGKDIPVVVRGRNPRLEWGQGIRNSAGSTAPCWTTEDDRTLAGIEADRRKTSTREIPE